ncbi:winged helix-turn-helix transcriptional regulator [Lactiplantibacillus mudanjiangensis]|uniref:Transcriptional regulator [Lactobacillus curvatus] n=1 Tax=Lactiplantibacillus mudanjiangensis TaxID=1296538 RepID=A0A660E1K3_9LACO|nr:helix-turn-helix domain-containing protein [Lactiplantibacillus mudanjiangensis]VDG19566.1 transcriptional regulator [Lactobacillus curvatus] [Lactiplantibacillus mudanjiangensis]VDG23395.1 transcriptional regulator [Lactobacillus curvatus] [Lactiplantibacillus mudanjiangensis]VDG29313.1 transcriptional regulator [Lactobacillus curvatus] [Lactiplantibacillus mudanjiangensis]VDG31013.1 transcriptional regulator [Lactobacillus curvatus] [Lactiplantibacillus mudanjiangensis]
MTIRKVYDCAPGCPVESTLQIIAGKWKSVIIYHLIQDHISHFGTLQRQIPACSRRMLALQLQELIADQIIVKTIDPATPLKTTYQLSAFGKTLTPVIMAMATWGSTYNQHQTADDSHQSKR